MALCFTKRKRKRFKNFKGDSGSILLKPTIFIKCNFQVCPLKIGQY